MTETKQSWIEVYGHGGDIETAAARFGQRAEAILDYSANINPLGPPVEVIAALRDGLGAVIRYPDPGHRRFKAMLAEHVGAGTENILVGNGAAECMALLLLALRPEIVGVVDPCFSEYRELALKFGADIRSVSGEKEGAWRASSRRIMELLSGCDLVFLGQPNNPNGVQYSLEDIRAIAGEAQRLGTWLVLDEAFMDFIPHGERQTLLPELSSYSRTVIIRSMTKFYAIPGLRLGYAVGHPDVIQSMSAMQVTWSVNGLALLAGEACLRSGSEYERRTLELIHGGRLRLTDGLQALGVDVTPGEVNYLLGELPTGWTAAAFQTAMGMRGVLIRSCAMYPGLGERHFRLAVKDGESNSRLLQTAAEVLQGSSRPEA